MMKFGIKNFRVFDEEGVILDIAPITILTGANCAGKSSLAKAMLLLESFLKQINKNLEDRKLDFTQYPLNTLGRYDKCIHKGSSTSKICFSYNVYSEFLFKEIEVTMQFDHNVNDPLNSGQLDWLIISNNEGTIYSWDRTDDEVGNHCYLNRLRDSYRTYVEYEHLFQKRIDLRHRNDIACFMGDSIEIDPELDKQIDEILKSDPSTFWCVANYMSKITKSKKFTGKQYTDEDIAWIKEHPSLFRLSILDYVDTLPKDEVEEFLLTMADKGSYPNNDDTQIKFKDFIRHLCSDFMQSSCNHLSEYGYTLEKDYFETEANKIGYYVVYPFNLSNIALPNYSYSLSRHHCFYIDSPNGPYPPLIIGDFRSRETMDFSYFFDIMAVLDFFYCTDGSKYYEWTESFDGDVEIEHSMFNNFASYYCTFVRDCLEPFLNFSYIGSSRVEVKRIYPLESNDSFANLLLRYNNAITKEKEKEKDSKIRVIGIPEKNYKSNTFLNKWIKKFGIGKELIFKADDNGLGIQIFIRKNDEEEPTLLAYEGYGITQLVSLLLNIEVSILYAQAEYTNRIGLKAFEGFKYETRTFIIEEPEIHLHPMYQSLLAEMFYEAYKEYNILFIIETHSEYLIRKTQAMVAKMGFESNEHCEKECPFQTIYVAKDKAPYSLGYRKDGKFKEDFGPGFFDEATNLLLEIY